VALLVSGCGGAPRPARHVVVIRAFQFEPASLTIAPGDTVEWRNQDIFAHTASAEDGSWDSGNLPADTSWSAVVSRPGTHAYRCLFHPTMKGQLDVR
jgi:plastocyanin